MAHAHHHGPEAPAGSAHAHGHRLGWAAALAAIYMVAEFVGGLWTNSLALLADASHMLSDVAALLLSFFALRIARRPADARRTFGYHRTEILAALVNGAALLAISAFIVLEGFERLRQPAEVASGPMMAIAAGGLAINLASLAILRRGKDANLNLRGAWLHVAMDTLGSVQALLAGALIWTLGWTWADPVASFLIAALVVYSSWHLVTEAVRVLMEGAPPHIDVDEVRRALLDLVGVRGVHDLHVWTITSGVESLSAHVVVEGKPHGEVLEEASTMLRSRFGIDHQTLQLEPKGFVEARPLDCP